MLAVFRAKVHKLQRRVRYWHKKARILDQALTQTRRELHFRTSFTKMNKRSKRTGKYERMSVRGGYKMAVLRNLGHISVSALLTTVNGPSSRQTAVTWEKRLAFTLMFRSQNLYAEHRAFKKCVQDEAPLARLRQDDRIY